MTDLLLVTSDFRPRQGGVANYYSQLATHLPSINVLTNVVSATGENIINASWTWPIWPKWLPLLWLVPWWKVRRQAKLLAAGEILPIGTALMLIRLAFGWPYLVFLHGLDFQLAQGTVWKRWLSGQILRFSQGIVVNSKFTSDLVVSSGISQAKIKIIYPSISQPVVSPEVIQSLKSKYQISNQRVILTISRLVKRKGIDRVISCLSKVESGFDNLVYVVVGHGPEAERLKEKSKTLKSRVIFTGNINDEEKYAWYEICELFILAPIDDKVDVEGFGIVYLEAQAAGKPIIGSRVGGVPEAVGESGILVANDSEMEKNILLLLTDETMRIKLGQAGRGRIKDFNVQKQADSFYNYIKT